MREAKGSIIPTLWTTSVYDTQAVNTANLPSVVAVTSLVAYSY
jgi:hypothetical protein